MRHELLWQCRKSLKLSSWCINYDLKSLNPLLACSITFYHLQMKTSIVKMRLTLTFFVVIALRTEISSQNLNSYGDHDDKCTIHASDDYQTTLEVDYKNYNSKGTVILGKMLSNNSRNRKTNINITAFYSAATRMHLYSFFQSIIYSFSYKKM